VPAGAAQPDANTGVTRRGFAAASVGLVVLCLAAALPLLSAVAPAETDSAAILGARPGYGPAAIGVPANAAAITRRIWMPGLDEGYNAQGLAVAGNSILVAAYRSDSPDVRRGPCRVFRIDPAKGVATGQVDVPSPCGHAGGLAVAGNGRLYVADTRTLFATDLVSAFDGAPPRFQVIPLGPGVTGGLAVSGIDAIWLGTYREDGPGRLYRFPTAMLDRLPEGRTLNVSDAAAQIAIPSHAQGAAIDAGGRLWVARSDLRWGELDRLDAATGRVDREYQAPPGIEGIAFDAAGRLWAVSEAGARHYYDSWRAMVLPFYPLIFAIDPERLQ
jgi:sugar lactone lactonase YvrE